MGIFDKLKASLSGGKLDVAARFELLREAVSGTMSSFYMAKDRKTGELVGLKLCNTEKVAAFELRFKGLKKPSEGEIATSLSHPSIVKTLEYGVTTKGIQYILMEFVEGPGLHALIHTRDAILDNKRVPLIRQMAESLAFVHKHDYIHRDICPRNFICSPDATSLKLIDFGLTLPAEREYMLPGNRTGTPMYMAPEIVKRRATDQRVDIFALGATAFHLCTFELPWKSGENPAMTAMSHDSVAPRDIFEFVPNLNRTLGKAIMQCLVADPSKRPQTVDDFLNMIREVECEFTD